MLRATAVVRKPAVKPERVADSVTLDHEGRQRRRVALTTDGGLEFLLDLEKPKALDDGDAVKLEDGRLILVKAAPERLLEITTATPLRLLRIAWHIGNRHTPAEITEGAIYIADDHVLADMVRGLGAGVAVVTRPFRPERGAYGGGHDHAHDHDHGHEHPAHDHDHHDHAGHAGHDHAHHDHDHAQCGHDHSHDPDHHDHDHPGHDHGPGHRHG